MMDTVQKTFLSMIKTALWNEPFNNEDKISPSVLFSEACRYEIAGVLSNNLDEFCEDDVNTRIKWSKKAMSDYHKASFVLAGQVSLCEFLASKNIKPVFLKGMAAAYYYRNPLLREIGDVDFIVPPTQFDTCCKILEQNGYEIVLGGDRHIEYKKQGIEYECHRYFSLNLSDNDKRVDEIIYDGCNECVKHFIEGKAFYVLPDDVNGIVLLEHLKHHMVSGVGFRQIIDWVVYVDSMLDDEKWNSSFHKLVISCGLEHLAKIITRTAQLYLGLRQDNITWCNDVDESVCSDLLEYIFYCSNFGFSKEDNENTSTLGGIARRGILKTLNTNAIAHIPIAKKIIILRPFAWLYQIIRWVIKWLINRILKRNKSDLYFKEWNKQKKLFEELGV